MKPARMRRLQEREPLVTNRAPPGWCDRGGAGGLRGGERLCVDRPRPPGPAATFGKWRDPAKPSYAVYLQLGIFVIVVRGQAGSERIRGRSAVCRGLLPAPEATACSGQELAMPVLAWTAGVTPCFSSSGRRTPGPVQVLGNRD